MSLSPLQACEFNDFPVVVARRASEFSDVPAVVAWKQEFKDIAAMVH